MKRNQKGFTLIEIIVVIIMIGVLAAIAVPIYTGYIYKARASEAITTLGAIKTFMLERRVSTGNWPSLDDDKHPSGSLYQEFNNFNELFYFTKDSIIYNTSGDIVEVGLKADDVNFGLPDDFDDPYVKIHFAFEGAKGTSGWSGGIVKKYATHLPPYTPTP